MAICVLLFSLVGVCYGYLILRPVTRAAKRSQFRARFQLSDFFWLVLLVQPPLMYVAYAFRRNARFNAGADFVGPQIGVIVMGAFLIAAVAYLWWRGAGVLSSLEVSSPLRRFVFLCVVVPVAVVGSLVVVPLAMFGIADILSGPSRYATDALIAISVLIFLVVIGVGCFRLNEWIVASGQKQASDENNIEKC